MKILNLDVISHPLNWVIVGLITILIGIMYSHFTPKECNCKKENF